MGARLREYLSGKSGGGRVRLSLSKENITRIEKRLFETVELIGTKQNRRAVLEEAAQIVAEASKPFAPVGKRKQTTRIRANGKKARYVSGNLKNSIRYLKRLRKDRGATIGPIYRRTSTGGRKGATPRTADGYYAHMVFPGGPEEFKDRVMGPGYRKSRARALKSIEVNLRRIERKVGRKLYR